MSLRTVALAIAALEQRDSDETSVETDAAQRQREHEVWQIFFRRDWPTTHEMMRRSMVEIYLSVPLLLEQPSDTGWGAMAKTSKVMFSVMIPQDNVVALCVEMDGDFSWTTGVGPSAGFFPIPNEYVLQLLLQRPGEIARVIGAIEKAAVQRAEFILDHLKRHPRTKR